MIAGLAQRLAPESRRQGRDWSTGWAGLSLILGGAAAVMLLPRLFGDPQSVDPDVWRLTGYFAALAAAALLVPSLRRMVPLTLALLTLTIPYSCWLWRLGYGGPAPTLIGDPYGLARNAFAGIAWLVLAAVMAFVVYRLSPNPRPRLRIWVRPGRTALLMAIGVSLLFLVVAFVLPAPLIGREGVPLLYVLERAPQAGRPTG